jgi:hypothetical protein
MLQLQLLFNIHPIENMEQILPKKKENMEHVNLLKLKYNKQNLSSKFFVSASIS